MSIYNLPDWLTTRVVLFEREMADGTWAEITLPVVIMAVCVFATWVLITRTTTGRQLYAFGDNPEGARRFGINIGAMQFIAFGWLGLMAGIAGLVQAHYAQEVVPNALYGRELDVLAAVVLGGARLGGGRGSVLGCILGVLLVSITQNGLNLMGVSPFAFKMIVGAIILVAITLSNTQHRAHPAVPEEPEGVSSMTAVDRPPARTRSGRKWPARLLAFVVVVIVFGVLAPHFLSAATFGSVAFQLPELGLLTLAMLMPIIPGGLNLAITFTANIAGLTLAWVLQGQGGVDAGVGAFVLARCWPSASAR